MPMLDHARPGGEERDHGFTLIELLVVIIIIGILAAIALPAFLRQRYKGWDTAVQSDLRNAALAEESYLTGATAYTTDIATLQQVGFKYSSAESYATSPASMTITANGAEWYCLTATSKSGTTFRWGSLQGGFTSAC